MKIGFFGGCFNPPTIAHISLAKKALMEANLDKVIFVPIGDFYDKKELAPAKDRYNMLKIACERLVNIEVSDIEINIKEKLYAIDAFKLVEEKYPNDEIYFIMGADNFINIINWKNGNEIILRYRFIVFERENISISEYIENNLKQHKDKILLIKNQEYKSLSSSEFRKIARETKQYNRDIIPEKVIDYIKENNLF